MTRTQATIHYLEAQRLAWQSYEAVLKAALAIREAAFKQAEEAYQVTAKAALVACEAVEKQAFEDYEAAKREEEA